MLFQPCAILYLHGISNTRAYAHRVGLYRVLLGLGYRVLAIDYRGFGDSSEVDLSEHTVVEDSRTAISWLRDKLDEGEKLIVWGHSLGAAIACRAVAEDDKENDNKPNITTLVLESHFNNLHEEILNVVFVSLGQIPAAVGKMLPVCRQLRGAGMEFCSDVWIRDMESDTVILHAEDDDTIHIELAEKLFKAALDHGKHNIDMVTFEHAHGLGHNNIYKYEGLPAIIEKYIDKL